MSDNSDIGHLLEFGKQIDTLSKEALENRIKQWCRRIEQFELLGRDDRAKVIFDELQLMVKSYRIHFKPKDEEEGLILSKDFQGRILAEKSIDEKLARYYERFGEDSEAEQMLSEEESNVPSSSDMDAVRKSGYSLAILKSLSSNPLSEKDLGDFPKLKKRDSPKEQDLGSLASFPKLKRKSEAGDPEAGGEK